MRVEKPHVWIAAFSALAVMLVAVVDSERTSPGPIAAVHGRIEDLAGGSACAACHGGFFQSMSDACFECHADIQAQVDTGDGLHGTFGAERAQGCALCHSEHHGPGFAMVNAQSFAQAGVRDVAAFDHGLVGFAMEGRHLELACTECHEHASDAILAPGTKRYLGLEPSCVACHEDPHESRFALACTDCHGQQSWDELFSLDHDAHLPLVGGHAETDCRACHATDDAHALEVLGGRGAKPEARACLDCHASPHATPFVQGVAALAGASEKAGCVVCHVAEHTQFRDADEITAEQHACSGFALVLPHAEVTCAECHDPERAEFAERYPGRGADACGSCHADPHGGQFAAGPFAGEGCIACHERERFEPHAFTTEKHARAALELSGSHLANECADCHSVPAEGEPRVFHGTPATCAGCHSDAHRGFFEPFANELEATKNGACAHCHLTTTFDELPAGGFDHARFASFPIAGAHAQGECSQCHAPAAEIDAHGRSFGFVEDHYGRFEGCQTCHADPHGGEFDDPALPARVGSAEGCARCHSESSFRTLAGDFDHALWTGYALAGAHAEIGCHACHAPLRTPDELGRTWARARGTSCADCHSDPHAGQFKSAGATDCARCHTDRDRFLLAFDHSRDSRFPLSEPHRALDCAACHKPWSAPGGGEVVRYRPLPTECVDCHGVQEDVLMRRKGKK